LKFWLFWKSGFFLTFFQSERLGSGKTLSLAAYSLQISSDEVYDHAGCTEYCKHFAVAQK